jgi:hypothetical protein
LAKYFPNLVADGFGGIIIRATDGMLKDKHYDTFYPAALDAGMVVMVYGAMYANRSGTDQAKFLIDTVLPLMDLVDGNLVAWNDGETNDGVSIQKHKDELMKWLAEASRSFLKVGVYGSIKTWSELYGNFVLPSQYYFWNAQWRSGNVCTLPVGIKTSQLVFWQNGVWPNHSWIPQPDTLPKLEDVDCNVMPGRSMQDLVNFSGQQEVTPPPPTPIPHTHPELQSQIDSITKNIVNLTSRVASLESKSFAPLQQVYFTASEDQLAYKIGRFNASKNEVFDFYGEEVGNRLHLTEGSKILVNLEPVYTGDGGFKALLIVDKEFIRRHNPTCPVYVSLVKGTLSLT